MEIKELKEGEYKQSSKILTAYWKEREMNYSQKWTNSYLLNGHKSEIKEDKFFVLKDEEIIGIVSLIISEGDVGEIRELVVKKEKRGNGYGKELLNFIINYAKQKNVRKLFALIFPEIKGFYEKFKFKEEGFLEDHFKDKENLFLMSLKLAKEKQIDLKSQLEKLDIQKKTEEKLLNLPLK